MSRPTLAPALHNASTSRSVRYWHIASELAAWICLLRAGKLHDCPAFDGRHCHADCRARRRFPDVTLAECIETSAQDQTHDSLLPGSTPRPVSAYIGSE